MATREQFNVRLPGYILELIDLISDSYGLTKTQTVILAIDRLGRDLNPDTGSNAAICEALLEARAE